MSYINMVNHFDRALRINGCGKIRVPLGSPEFDALYAEMTQQVRHPVASQAGDEYTMGSITLVRLEDQP